MKNKQKKAIIFITPTLDRKGSEIGLINLLNHIDSSFHVKLIAKYKGVLFDTVLPAIEKIFFFNGKPKRNYYSRIKARLEIKWNIASILSKEKNNILYINTIILPDILAYAEKHKMKTIVHTHELEQMYSQLNKEQIQRLISYPSLIIANSNASASVIKKFGRESNIEICYECLDTQKVVVNKEDYIEYRKKLGIDDNTFLWVMSGSIDENKNPFLFIEIAKEILSRKSNVKFLWIGGTTNKRFEQLCKDKTDYYSLTDKIIWLGNMGDEYYRYFNCANGFVLTSIKESLSLVTVEALLLGLPVVTQNCGGVLEILRTDIGKVVEEKNNAVLMANEMIKFMDGTYKVDKAKQIVRAKEFDSAAIAMKWNSILKKYFKDL